MKREYSSPDVYMDKNDILEGVFACVDDDGSGVQETDDKDYGNCGYGYGYGYGYGKGKGKGKGYGRGRR